MPLVTTVYRVFFEHWIATLLLNKVLVLHTRFVTEQIPCFYMPLNSFVLLSQRFITEQIY
jgi:hypothetical protein